MIGRNPSHFKSRSLETSQTYPVPVTTPVTMGFRTGYVITSMSFLFGVLFIASVYDFPLIYQTPFRNESAIAAEHFYLSAYNGPGAIHALLHGMMALGIIGAIAKLHRWSETAKYFDGSCIVLMVISVAMYVVVIVPNLKLLSDPTNLDLLNRSSIRTERDSIIMSSGGTPPELYDTPLTQNERISALRIIAATNTIIMALLGGVVLLQCSEVYIEESEKKEAEKKREQAAEELRLQLQGKGIDVETKKTR
ncbi:unnamed protein product [Sympodiomycopsis kandeliae]